MRKSHRRDKTRARNKARLSDAVEEIGIEVINARPVRERRTPQCQHSFWAKKDIAHCVCFAQRGTHQLLYHCIDLILVFNTQRLCRVLVIDPSTVKEESDGGSRLSHTLSICPLEL